MIQDDMVEKIPRKDSWIKIHPITKGWSSDKKFYIENDLGEKKLLRIAEISQFETKRREYENMNILSKLGINISLPDINKTLPFTASLTG